MADVSLTAPVKRVGNSLAIFIPADKARSAHLKEGDTVHAVLKPEAPEVLGLLQHLGLGPFSRRDEGLWHDRA
ncbi:MAG: hypothetical protein LC623_04490 [Halobacteriales archaeon]|nr:hypothetical protein [Halobacteriales archaeon]